MSKRKNKSPYPDMPKDQFKYIESCLSYYHKNIEKIDEIKVRIIEANRRGASGYVDDNQYLGIRSTNKDSATLYKVLEIDDNVRVERLQTLVSAVGYVLSNLPDTLEEPYLRLIQLRYWENKRRLTMIGIANELSISERTAYRMRKRIIYLIGKELGEW
ncbi:hypothetical protein HB884_11420 [Listeria booriae]|uniref:hypothetical protein n=1 Tax=Listeria booriae TaxID=1552123 RepID=UPI001625B94B|nr:hypothetical protein [Listeria booriae]MBC1524809.1 hypothetical protein [Listeria booriae]